MTKAEYDEFVQLCDRLEEEEHQYYLAELLAAQDLKIKDQTLHIKILEGLLTEKRDKLVELEETLARLENEIMRLK